MSVKHSSQRGIFTQSTPQAKFFPPQNVTGFTLIELLVVMAIIGILAGIVVVSISESRRSGNDAARKSQTQEILKALEFYHSENGVYPLYGNSPGSSGTGGDLTNINTDLYVGADKTLNRLPDVPSDYYYCVSADRKSIVIAVNTEEDFGGSNYCSVKRGPGPDYGCAAFIAPGGDGEDDCVSRF